MTTRCDAGFKNRMLEACLSSLEHAGFRRYRKDSVDWPIDKEFNAWVGLNTALFDDRLEINPFIGVHAVAVEKMWLSLSGKKYPGPYGRTATYGVHFGELDGAKTEPAFAFAPQQSIAFIKSEGDRLATLYRTQGVAFAESIASYRALLPLLRARISMLGGYPQRVACCLHLMGNDDEARQFVEQFYLREPVSFEVFATAFIAMLDERDR